MQKHVEIVNNKNKRIRYVKAIQDYILVEKNDFCHSSHLIFLLNDVEASNYAQCHCPPKQLCNVHGTLCRSQTPDLWSGFDRKSALYAQLPFRLFFFYKVYLGWGNGGG